MGRYNFGEYTGKTGLDCVDLDLVEEKGEEMKEFFAESFPIEQDRVEEMGKYSRFPVEEGPYSLADIFERVYGEGSAGGSDEYKMRDLLEQALDHITVDKLAEEVMRRLFEFDQWFAAPATLVYGYETSEDELDLTWDVAYAEFDVGDKGYHLTKNVKWGHSIEINTFEAEEAKEESVEEKVVNLDEARSTEIHKMTVPQLKTLAKALGCTGYSKLRKSALIVMVLRAKSEDDEDRAVERVFGDEVAHAVRSTTAGGKIVWDELRQAEGYYQAPIGRQFCLISQVNGVMQFFKTLKAVHAYITNGWDISLVPA